MARKILFEVDLGLKGVEKCDVGIYLDGRLVENRWDIPYNDLHHLAEEFRSKYSDAEIETYCWGEDCIGRSHRWKIDI